MLKYKERRTEGKERNNEGESRGRAVLKIRLLPCLASSATAGWPFQVAYSYRRKGIGELIV
jgi:hypothetical protein